MPLFCSSLHPPFCCFQRSQLCPRLTTPPPTHTQVLAKKMTVLYKLAAEQLSKQHHYDFGLRALKSVLAVAGALKRADPTGREDLVLMRALRDANLPKFVAGDAPLFLGLIADLFPGLQCPRARHAELGDAFEAELAAGGYQVPGPGGS